MREDEPDRECPDPPGEERLRRKLQHLNLALRGRDGPLSSGFCDVHLIHRAVPAADLPDIHLHTALRGRDLSSPFLVDAMTGGPDAAERINAALAGAAADVGWGVAVGSQQVALDDPQTRGSFQVVRRRNPDGLVLANLGAGVNGGSARRAVRMIGADGLQLHLNAAQELLMPEGDRCFADTREAIRDVVEACPVPVLVKEVGFGISAETACELLRCGVHGINVAGAGGTNFAEIEVRRTSGPGDGPVQPRDFRTWGIPTVPSLVETVSAARCAGGTTVIASGGVRSPLDAVRALVLGADLVAVAAPVLRALEAGGEEGVADLLRRWNRDARRFLLLLGATRVDQLGDRPYVITGRTAEYLRARGLPVARR